MFGPWTTEGVDSKGEGGSPQYSNVGGETALETRVGREGGSLGGGADW